MPVGEVDGAPSRQRGEDLFGRLLPAGIDLEHSRAGFRLVPLGELGNHVRCGRSRAREERCLTDVRTQGTGSVGLGVRRGIRARDRVHVGARCYRVRGRAPSLAPRQRDSLLLSRFFPESISAAAPDRG
jgi:hypothetical protein